MTSHFLAITPGFYDASTIHGIYASFREARDDIERRMQPLVTGAAFGRPVTSEPEYIDQAEIEEWIDGKVLRGWDRRGLQWRQAWGPPV